MSTTVSRKIDWIDRDHPELIVFLLDQSGSMNDALAGGTRSKADEAADAINKTIQVTLAKCIKPEGVRDYFNIGVIGYGKDGEAASLLKSQTHIPISKLKNLARTEKRTKKLSDGAGGLVDMPVDFATWFEKVADDGTPMLHALGIARQWLLEWVGSHQHCYPPILINITDGRATDSTPQELIDSAKQIMALSTASGNAQVWNCHLSDRNESAVSFPSDESQLPKDELAGTLFDMSSILTEKVLMLASEKFNGLKNTSRGYVFNAGIEQLIDFLDVGTRQFELR
jgi:hypothetical protein